MSAPRILGLIAREALHRKLGSALFVIAVATAVAACVVLAMTGEAAERETRRVTRDLGFNLEILPLSADIDEFLLSGLSTSTMAEDVLRRLAAPQKIVWNHLVAVLEKRVPAGSGEVLLTGLSTEIIAPGEKKSPMTFSIEPGTVHLGREAARRLGAREGGEAEISGKKFRVVRCLPEAGSADDLRAFAALADVQSVLNLPGKIGAIRAIDCLCLLPREDPLSIIRAEVERLAPEAMVVLDRRKADARALGRRTVERHAAFAVPFIVAVCAAWTLILALLNVRERAGEIALFRALGHRSGTIAGLFLGRAALLAIPGALLGFAAGTWLALEFGPGIFLVTAKAIEVRPALLGWSLLGAPLFAALASYAPAMVAVTKDPAAVLRGE